MVSHRPRLAAGTLVAASLLIATACSGDDDTASTTTVQLTTTAAPTTSAPPTTAPETTRVPTTVAAPTTAEPTTVPSTSPSETISPEPTTTTLPEGVPPRVTFPDDEDKQAVVDAFYAYDDALTQALRDPADERLVEDVLALTTGDQAERVEAFLADLADAAQAARPGTVGPSYTDVVEPTVLVVDTSAALDVCIVDTDVLVEVGAGSDGGDLVIDDSYSSVFDSYNFDLEDGDWKVSDIVRVDRYEGQLGCG